MIAKKKACSFRVSFRLLVCGAMLAAAGVSWSYDLELDFGARAGSFLPSALGVFSLNATRISGAFALGATADGEVSLDSGGNPGVDASFRGDASLSFGSFIAGLRLEADALRVVETGEETLDFYLSAPLTLNGSELSLSCFPVVGIGFYDDASASFGADAYASWLAGDFVLKPGAKASWVFFPDGTRSLEVAPSVGFVWYPGLPVSADFSVGWNRSETESGIAAVTYPVSALVSAVPFPWLCLTVAYEGEIGSAGLSSYRIDGECELIRYGIGGTAFHLPLSAYYESTENGGVRFGASLLVGVSYGKNE